MLAMERDQMQREAYAESLLSRIGDQLCSADLRPTKEYSRWSKSSEIRSEACGRNDAAAVAALFTEDALLVAPDGMSSGRQNIEK